MSTPAKAMPSRAVEIVGAANFTDDPREGAAYAVDGMRPSAAVRPGTANEVAELVKLAAAEKLAVIPIGARTKLGIGMPPAGYDLAIDMTRLDRVISYDPGDLTLSVEAGIPLAKLAATLAEHKQFVPLAVPFYERATIGGTLASGVDSPLRQMYGTARDFVLGMEFVTGDGALAKSGGRVVKNVSGCDLHKLMLGAIGSLGIITRINLKTFPLPSMQRLFVASFASSDEALTLRQKITASPISPTSLEIVSPEMVRLVFPQDTTSNEWLLMAGISGSDKALDRCSNDLRQMAGQCNAKNVDFLSGSDGEKPSTRLREAIPLTLQSSPAAVVLKITAVPSDLRGLLQFLEFESEYYDVRATTLIRGTGVVYWSILPDSAEALKEKSGASEEVLNESNASEKHNFRATVFACTPELKREMNVWGKPGEDFPLMQRVKQAFDPHGIFAPGRFVGGL